MSHGQLHDFASTPRKGLPEHVKRMADGGKVSNQVFQQKQPVGWMERARKSSGKPAPHMADGKKDGSSGNWMERAFSSNKGGLHRATHTPEGKTIPSFQVKKMAASGSAHQKKMAQAAINANPGKY